LISAQQRPPYEDVQCSLKVVSRGRPAIAGRVDHVIQGCKGSRWIATVVRLFQTDESDLNQFHRRR
jgi:hypothetical protein